MSDTFDFNVDGIDRAALLAAAAASIDEHLGPLADGKGGAETAEGRLVREFATEEASLAAYPDVYRITGKDFVAKGKPAPVALTELTHNFDYLWIRFPVGLRPARGWAFHLIEVRIEFNPSDPPQVRPKAYAILPKQEFQTLLKANTHLQIALDESLQFSAKAALPEADLGQVSATGSAKLSAVAKAGAGAVFGPFDYTIKRARIEHSATGLEWVFWRIDGAEFFQDDSPELVVIAQVPKHTKAVVVNAQLQASRQFNLLSAPLRSVIEHIPQMFREFFKKGMPLRDNRTWDIAVGD